MDYKQLTDEEKKAYLKGFQVGLEQLEAALAILLKSRMPRNNKAVLHAIAKVLDMDHLLPTIEKPLDANTAKHYGITRATYREIEQNIRNQIYK